MNEEAEIKKASILRRAAAFYLDLLIISLILIIGLFLSIGPDFEDVDFGMLILVFNLYMIMGILAILFKDFFNGMSLGRFVFNIAVRDANNYQVVPSKSKLILRNIPMLIWPIEFIFLLVNSDRKRIGDRIANTQVIKLTQKRSRIKRLFIVLCIFIIIVSVFVLSIFQLLRNSEAYKVSTDFIYSNQEVINITDGIEGFGLFPSGSISEINGFGEAEFRIKTLGKSRDIEIWVYLTQKPNQSWIIEKYELARE